MNCKDCGIELTSDEISYFEDRCGDCEMEAFGEIFGWIIKQSGRTEGEIIGIYPINTTIH
jgi:hypothetical protein